MNWIFNKRGDAFDLSFADRFFIADKCRVCATCGGQSFCLETFDTDEEARAYIRELVKKATDD